MLGNVIVALLFVLFLCIIVGCGIMATELFMMCFERKKKKKK